MVHVCGGIVRDGDGSGCVQRGHICCIAVIVTISNTSATRSSEREKRTYHFSRRQTGPSPGGGIGRPAVVTFPPHPIAQLCRSVVGVDDIVCSAGEFLSRHIRRFDGPSSRGSIGGHIGMGAMMMDGAVWIPAWGWRWGIVGV